MPLNDKPIFTGKPQIEWYSNTAGTSNVLKTANASSAIIPENYVIFTAGADGGFVQKVRFRPLGTNIATVARIFINNGLTYLTYANNIIYEELSIPATTLNHASAQPLFEVTLNLALPAGYRLFASLGTTVAAGFDVSVIGGSYETNIS